MKLQQMKNGQYMMTIPRELVRAKGWVKGTELNIKIDMNGDYKIKEDQFFFLPFTTKHTPPSDRATAQTNPV